MDAATWRAAPVTTTSRSHRTTRRGSVQPVMLAGREEARLLKCPVLTSHTMATYSAASSEASTDGVVWSRVVKRNTASKRQETQVIKNLCTPIRFHFYYCCKLIHFKGKSGNNEMFNK